MSKQYPTDAELKKRFKESYERSKPRNKGQKKRSSAKK